VEPDRRWSYLVPLATAVGAVAALAASTHAAPAAVDRRVPIVGALTRLARAIGGAQAERGLAIVAVAAAVTVVAQLVAQARPGWAGRLAGVVAAGAMVSSPALRPLAAALSPATISLVALAVSVLTIDRVARGGGAAAGRGFAVAAVVAALLDPRAWPLFAVGAALIVYRARRGAPWARGALAVAAITAVVAIVPTLFAGGPRAPAWPHAAIDLAVVVDDLGPLALALALAGAFTALATRGDRWLAGALGAALAAGVPVAAPLAPGLVIAVAVAAGLAVASFLGRAPAVRHQVVAAASVLALLASATWLG